uniref:Shugoshin_C domain-containing protein n=1 Tax=Caenorhabditis tropicalis TaxID=1561998 RepID=A0A1I7UF11_9PELO
MSPPTFTKSNGCRGSVKTPVQPNCLVDEKNKKFAPKKALPLALNSKKPFMEARRHQDAGVILAALEFSSDEETHEKQSSRRSTTRNINRSSKRLADPDWHKDRTPLKRSSRKDYSDSGSTEIVQEQTLHLPKSGINQPSTFGKGTGDSVTTAYAKEKPTTSRKKSAGKSADYVSHKD